MRPYLFSLFVLIISCEKHQVYTLTTEDLKFVPYYEGDSILLTNHKNDSIYLKVISMYDTSTNIDGEFVCAFCNVINYNNLPSVSA